jgi:putative addiction module CopG family antidote
MYIHLSDDLQTFINDQVRNGRYSSEDEVVRDALLRLSHDHTVASSVAGDSFIGSMREDAELLDQIVEDAMKNREQPWRLDPDE